METGTGFAAFAMWNALKLHFTSDSYDYFKYHGKTNVSKNTFANRKDKYSFYKLSRKYQLDELRDFYIANFLEGEIKWVGDITGPDGEATYRKWQKRIQALTYNFESDIVYLLDKYAPLELIKVTKGNYPKLLIEVMEGNIGIETVVIMNRIMAFWPMWQERIDDDILWPNWDMKIRKYELFVNFDTPKVKQILKEKIKEYAKTPNHETVS